MLNSLKIRLLLSMIVVVAVTIGLIAIAVVKEQRELAQGEALKEMRSLGEMVVTNTTAPLLFSDPQAAANTLQGLRAIPDIYGAAVFQQSGEVFTLYGDLSLARLYTSEQVRSLLRAQTQEAGVGPLGMHTFLPVTSEGEAIGAVLLANNMNGLRARMARFADIVALSGSAAFLVSLVLMFWLQRIFTTPLQQLIAVMQQIRGTGDYSQRTPVSPIAEFNLLSQNFNHMIAEIEARGAQLERSNAELEGRVRERTVELESALKLANQSNRTKSRFLAVMSHEVRTPLNGIIGFLELLKLKNLEPSVTNIVRSLDKSVHTLLELLNEILDFTKLEAEKIELDYQDVDIRAMVESVIETHSALAGRKNLEIRSEFRLSHDRYVGDITRLRQILNNFVSNAIKFTDQGSVGISVSAQDVHSESLVTFRISDTGIGIARDSIKQIFTPFTQVDSSITRKYGGTGLGLAISRQLIELMDGTCGVESEPGQGSTFWFTVPMTRSDKSLQAVANEKPAARIMQRPGTLLVAEDNRLNQEVIVHLLRAFGHSCDLARSGSEVLEMAAARRYDLIFMDYHMPGMDGVAASRKIRALGAGSPNHDTPIIALTADIQPHVNKQFKRAGANDVLLKPFNLAALERCLARWMYQRGVAAATTAGAGDSRVLNASVLEEIAGLESADSGAVVEKLTAIFLEQSPPLLDRIRAAAEGGDAEALFSAAHSLKSSAANLGAEKLAGICKRLEALGRENALAEARAMLDALAACFDETCATLQQTTGVS